MSDLTTYRIKGEWNGVDDLNVWLGSQGVVLVPDGRLEAIANAWNELTIVEQTEMPTPMYRAMKDALREDTRPRFDNTYGFVEHGKADCPYRDCPYHANALREDTE